MGITRRRLSNFTYPVTESPSEIKSLDLVKLARFESRLIGIKGQYLLFDDGVLNVRKFSGHQIEVRG